MHFLLSVRIKIKIKDFIAFSFYLRRLETSDFFYFIFFIKECLISDPFLWSANSFDCKWYYWFCCKRGIMNTFTIRTILDCQSDTQSLVQFRWTETNSLIFVMNYFIFYIFFYSLKLKTWNSPFIILYQTLFSISKKKILRFCNRIFH